MEGPSPPRNEKYIWFPKEQGQKLRNVFSHIFSSRPHGVSCLPLPACLFYSLLPESIFFGQRLHLCHTHRDLTTQWQSEPSSHQDLPVPRSSTQSVSQFQISGRKNQNGADHPRGWFPRHIPNCPISFGHRQSGQYWAGRKDYSCRKGASFGYPK